MGPSADECPFQPVDMNRALAPMLRIKNGIVLAARTNDGYTVLEATHDG